jgi:hypothetical protein
MMQKTLPVLMVLYGAASLFHFVHNATYIQAYPNLPAWITPVGVYVSWCVIAAIGVVGYWVRATRIGLVLIAVYALFGFDGLDHYMLAPMGAHTLAMNASILTEVVAAAVLLGYVARTAFVRRGD